MEWGHIKGDDLHYSDEELVDLIHKALKNWKNAEMQAEKYKNNNPLKGKYISRAAALKNIYMSLHNEARRRRVTLQRRQLLKRILFPLI